MKAISVLFGLLCGNGLFYLTDSISAGALFERTYFQVIAIIAYVIVDKVIYREAKP